MRQLAGYKFRKQHPVGKYVVDFVCMETRLAIEIDGGQHSGNTLYDAARTRSFEAEGYRVLRFWNNDVMADIEGVMVEICRVIGKPPPP